MQMFLTMFKVKQRAKCMTCPNSHQMFRCYAWEEKPSLSFAVRIIFFDISAELGIFAHFYYPVKCNFKSVL